MIRRTNEVGQVHPDDDAPRQRPSGDARDWWQFAARLFAIGLSLFTICSSAFIVFSPIVQRGVHLALALALVVLTAKSSGHRPWWKTGTDLILISIVIITSCYLIWAYPNLAAGRDITAADIAVGVAFILLLMEACRRAMGWTLPVLALIVIAYSYLGPYLPLLFSHSGYPTDRLISHLFLTTDGIFGIALSVSATFIAALVLFAAFFERSGAGRTFIDLALALTGRTRAGPATVAVFSSSAMGSISGSAAANVVTTGAFTIPLMKRVGYRSPVAGAIESVASTGGMIMPPVMGAGAFIMAEYLGVPYVKVALAALIPAVLYYLSLLTAVHFYASKQGLARLDPAEIPKLRQVLKHGWPNLLPLLVLIGLLFVAKLSPTLSAMCAIASILVLALIRNGPRFTWKLVIEGLEAGAKAIPPVAVACAIAGVLVGVFTLTGLTFRLSDILTSLAGGTLITLLLLTMVTCIILGMGMPATPAYIIIAVLAVPAMIELDVVPLSAHLFAYYYGVLSNITPPIAVAAFAAAGLTGDSPLKIGVTAARLGAIVYVIPFFFIYRPSLLLQGDISEILLGLTVTAIGVFAISAALSGWLNGRLPIVGRLILLAAGAGLVIPNVYASVLGASLVVAVIGWTYRRRGFRHLSRGDAPDTPKEGAVQEP